MESTTPEDDNFQALIQGFAMIIVSEIGDKTFLIAAILAMRHPRGIVFAGAFGSLVVMSALSAALGHILPTLIPKKWTQVAAATLFFVFGAKMLLEARAMEGGSAKIDEEMREAEEEIEEDEAAADGTGGMDADGNAVPLEVIEEGGRASKENHIGNGHIPHSSRSPSRSRQPQKRSSASFKEGARNFCSLFFGPVFVQAFVLTFLGEWGDRSQIATIALGAAHNVYVVTLGTVLGHSCCTALAVIGGRYVSTKISVKHVTLGGAVLFIIFGLIYFYEAFTLKSEYVLTDPDDQAAILHITNLRR